MRLHQPHPPGYFLYSMFGKVVNLIMVDENNSLVLISVLSGNFQCLGDILVRQNNFQQTGWFISRLAYTYSSPELVL